MLSIRLAGQRFHLPEHWGEVPPSQLTPLLELLYARPGTGDTHHEVLRRALGLSRRDWTRLSRHYFAARLPAETRQANARTLHDLLTRVQWLWTADLTVPPLPHLTVQGERYLLFEPGFQSLTFGELTDAYIHARAYVQQLVPGETRLNHLLATVCRPARRPDDANDGGDPREPYQPARTPARAERLAAVPFAERVAVLLYFLGTLKEFLSHFDLFDGPDVGSEEYPGQGFIKNGHLLAEKGIFGNLRQVQQTNVHEVFLYLEEHRKDEKARYEAEKAAHSTPSP